MDDINIYNDSAIILKQKTPKKIISWVNILFLLTFLLLIAFFIPFNKYKSYIGYISLENDNAYINLELNESDFPVNKKSKLYIKDKEYKYEVIDIKGDKVALKIDLEDYLKIENNIVIVNIFNKSTTIYKNIYNKIKKGFDV